MLKKTDKVLKKERDGERESTKKDIEKERQTVKKNSPKSIIFGSLDQK